MRLDEAIHAIEIVDARCVLDVGRCRVLMALAKAHQRFVRPRIIVEDRDLDDPRLERGLGLGCRFLDRLQLLQHVGWLDDVGIELDLKGGVGRADFGHALDLRAASPRW